MPEETLENIFVAPVPKDVLSERWEFFSYYLQQALPAYSSDNPARSGNLLAALLDGKAKLYTVHKGGAGLQIMFVLARSADPITGDIYLVLMALVSVQKMSTDVLQTIKDFLLEETKRVGCKKLVAFTGIDSVVTAAKQMGAEVSYMLTLEV